MSERTSGKGAVHMRRMVGDLELNFGVAMAGGYDGVSRYVSLVGRVGG